MNRFNIDVHLKNGNKFFITTVSFAETATVLLNRLLNGEDEAFIVLDDIYTNKVYAIAKEEIEGLECVKIGEGGRNEE